MSVGDFHLDRHDERLIGPHGPVRIGHKAFMVLLTLADEGGRLMTKDALFDTVWKDISVSESALTTVIRELRRAMGDDSKQPKYIESVYGRGYRLIAPIEAVAPVGEAPSATPTSAPKQSGGTGSPPRILVADFDVSALEQGASNFVIAIREEILLGLSRFREIEVIDGDGDVRGDGSRDYRLDARFLPQGKGFRLMTRLQRLGDGAIVWGETHQLDSDQLGSGIEAIMRKIVGAAFPALDQDISIGAAAAGDTLFDRYMVAKRRSLNAQDRIEAQEAARELEAIVAAKPDFALAYPPLVRLYNIDYGYTAFGSSGAVERGRALELAKAGLAADRSHVHAYTVLGFCHLYHEEFDQARSCFLQALERNPYNPVRLNEVATGMTYLGDFKQARELFEQAYGIQPQTDDANHEDLGRLAWLEGDLETAHAHFVQITDASIWSQLCVAVTTTHRSPKKGEKAMQRWKDRVHKNWHRPIPPDDKEVFEWVKFHNPFEDDAGDPIFELVADALKL
nr:winged helix-turn-helix domain-containing protein [Sphingomicrobium sediminis]